MQGNPSVLVGFFGMQIQSGAHLGGIALHGIDVGHTPTQSRGYIIARSGSHHQNFFGLRQ